MEAAASLAAADGTAVVEEVSFWVVKCSAFDAET